LRLRVQTCIGSDAVLGRRRGDVPLRAESVHLARDRFHDLSVVGARDRNGDDTGVPI
jgi:hypothetical protein